MEVHRHRDVPIPGVHTFGQPFPGEREAPVRTVEAPAPLAGLGRRVLATALTAVLTLVLPLVVLWSLGRLPSSLAVWSDLSFDASGAAVVVLLASMVLTALLYAGLGAAPGGLVCGIRVGRADGVRRRAGFWRTMGRALALVGPGILTGGLWWLISMTFAVLDRRALKQGLHERMSKTTTVRRQRSTCEERVPSRRAKSGQGVDAAAARVSRSGRTFTESLEVTGIHRPAPGALEPWGDGPEVRWRLEVVDGPAVLLETSCYIGRYSAENPEVSTAEFLRIRDARVSKTHGLFSLDRGQVHFTDLASTNGSVLKRAGQQRNLQPHVAMPLKPGDEVHVGNHVVVLRLLG